MPDPDPRDLDSIRTAAGVDAQWLTAVFRRAGLGTSNRVVAIDVGSVGTGQMGENVRYVLTWEHHDPDLPASVIGKFPSASPISRATAVQVNSYRQEVGFYREIRPHVTIRVPHAYHVGWDDATHDFVLIMEDITPAHQGDQIEGCSVSQAELLIDQAVGLHAPTWGRGLELAAQIDWLQSMTPERVEFTGSILGHTWPGFVDRYQGPIGDADVELGAALIGRYGALIDAVRRWAERCDGWCVTHGDYRPDNVLFGSDASAPPVTVVDWQVIGIGIGPSDVAYFCGAGLLPETRQVHERALVARYAAGLRAAGVDISDDVAWDGYVLGAANGYLMAVIASQIVERTDRGDDMFVAMATRHADHIRTVGLLDALDRGAM